MDLMDEYDEYDAQCTGYLHCDAVYTLKSGLITQGEAILQYNPREPFVIDCEFLNADGHTIGAWEISRDLLRDGIAYGQAGMGDIRVSCHGGLLVITFDNKDGKSLVRLGTYLIRDFIDSTYLSIRRGDEPLDIDKELEEILR